MPKPQLILDHEAALTGSAIREKVQDAKTLETVLRKAIGILQEQGVYAAILYLHAKEKETGKVVALHLMQLCGSVVGGTGFDAEAPKDQLTYLSTNVTNDIAKTLLVRHLWEQTLVYGIYHCKI